MRCKKEAGTLTLGSLVDPNVFEMLATNEHGMQQVTFSNDHLGSAVTTGLMSPGETALKAGIAWFSAEVEADDNNFKAMWSISRIPGSGCCFRPWREPGGQCCNGLLAIRRCFPARAM
jgi:hypothetical protein